MTVPRSVLMAPVQLATAVHSVQVIEELPMSLPVPVNRTIGWKLMTLVTVDILLSDNLNVLRPVWSVHLVSFPPEAGVADSAFTQSERLALMPPGL